MIDDRKTRPLGADEPKAAHTDQPPLTAGPPEPDRKDDMSDAQNKTRPDPEAQAASAQDSPRAEKRKLSVEDVESNDGEDVKGGGISMNYLGELPPGLHGGG